MCGIVRSAGIVDFYLVKVDIVKRSANYNKWFQEFINGSILTRSRGVPLLRLKPIMPPSRSPADTGN